ncbi:rRNA pseudouridine synthase [Alphaproteobacteria bacterium]|nr:rRNA pseudouridine synthase [Alphaproteobacteria bacterium]
MKNSFIKKDAEQSENQTPITQAENPKNVSERIAKKIARSGLCSRREAERWILNGQVKLNNKILNECGVNVTETDIIEVNGELLPNKVNTKLWLYHKERGYLVTNNDPEGRSTIFDQLKTKMDTRFISVGRLDMDSEGLILLTNDGDLARKLELPATGWLRKYRVRVHGYVSAQDLEPLKNGISVDGIKYGRIDAALDRQQGSNAWLTMSFREGKNREVRNVMNFLGYSVNRLIRISFGPFNLKNLASGELEEVKQRVLSDQLGLSKPKKPARNQSNIR